MFPNIPPPQLPVRQLYHTLLIQAGNADVQFCKSTIFFGGIFFEIQSRTTVVDSA